MKTKHDLRCDLITQEINAARLLPDYFIDPAIIAKKTDQMINDAPFHIAYEDRTVFQEIVTNMEIFCKVYQKHNSYNNNNGYTAYDDDCPF
ncbi:MAG: hypothetical protein DRQ51_01305 [Gammaproteobacteria bacterium]|nr:MAG: hypothetical protein DRQ51_01305 [Gammaproteobacteria bacterium]